MSVAKKQNSHTTSSRGQQLSSQLMTVDRARGPLCLSVMSEEKTPEVRKVSDSQASFNQIHTAVLP